MKFTDEFDLKSVTTNSAGEKSQTSTPGAFVNFESGNTACSKGDADEKLDISYLVLCDASAVDSIKNPKIVTANKDPCNVIVQF
jgi:hypothetical protein